MYCICIHVLYTYGTFLIYLLIWRDWFFFQVDVGILFKFLWTISRSHFTWRRWRTKLLGWRLWRGTCRCVFGKLWGEAGQFLWKKLNMLVGGFPTGRFCFFLKSWVQAIYGLPWFTPRTFHIWRETRCWWCLGNINHKLGHGLRSFILNSSLHETIQCTIINSRTNSACFDNRPWTPSLLFVALHLGIFQMHDIYIDIRHR